MLFSPASILALQLEFLGLFRVAVEDFDFRYHNKIMY